MNAPIIGRTADYRRDDFYFRREQSASMRAATWAPRRRTWAYEIAAGFAGLALVILAYVEMGQP